MTETSPQNCSNTKLSPVKVELNNNTPRGALKDSSFALQRKGSAMSMSSASSSNSDISEDPEEDSKLQEGATPTSEDSREELDIRKLFRSLSDGQASKTINQDLADVFPSLPNSFLKKLGLHGVESRASLNEEELEQKFVALSLAFTIDAATIKDRCERQRRSRDQTESNLIGEIDRLIEKVTHIQPLCVDAETAELLSGLLSQIDVVIRACSHAAISAERFGAVQHEERLADAVNLMINHVTVLKQQRDSTKKQLEKVLQDTNPPESPNGRGRTAVPSIGKTVTRRRASIATISQPLDSGKNSIDNKRITRRTSDLTNRVTSFARTSRSSRLELGVDLDNIKECIVENSTTKGHENTQNNHSDESDHDVPNNSAPTSPSSAQSIEHISSLSLREKVTYKCRKFSQTLQDKYEDFVEDNSLHDFFYCGALLCFSLAIIILCNLLIEIKYVSANLSHESSYWQNMFNGHTFRDSFDDEMSIS